MSKFEFNEKDRLDRKAHNISNEYKKYLPKKVLIKLEMDMVALADGYSKFKKLTMDREELKKELDELCYLYEDLSKRARDKNYPLAQIIDYAGKFEKKREELLDKLLNNINE